MIQRIKERAVFLASSIRATQWKWLALPLAALTALQTVRQELPLQWQQNLQLLNVLPNWPWQAWACILLAVVLLLVIDGSFRASGLQPFSETLKPISQKNFLNETIELDGKAFFNCDFENCTLLYRGHGHTSMTQVRFKGNIACMTTHPAAKQFAKMLGELQNFPNISTVVLAERETESGRIRPIATMKAVHPPREPG